MPRLEVRIRRTQGVRNVPSGFQAYIFAPRPYLANGQGLFRANKDLLARVNIKPAAPAQTLNVDVLPQLDLDGKNIDVLIELKRQIRAICPRDRLRKDHRVGAYRRDGIGGLLNAVFVFATVRLV